MLFQDKMIVTQIIVGLFTIWFLIKFFYSLYKRKGSIVIAVDNCSHCPFKREWSEPPNYYCGLKKIVGEVSLSSQTTTELKKKCPINGKLEISVSKA